jgi:hypothetical protein
MARFEQTFSEQLHQVIESSGYRISPRLPTIDRLAKYIQLSCNEQGMSMDDSEASTAASLVYMKYMTNETPINSGHVEPYDENDGQDEDENDNDSIESDDENDSDYEEPSYSKSNSKSKSVAPIQVTLHTRSMTRVVQHSLGRSGNNRRTTSHVDNHPMVRRSQV